MASDAPHRRTKSSVLSIASFLHRRTPSDGITLPSSNDNFIASPVHEDMPTLSRGSRALGELHSNHQSPPQSSLSPKKGSDGKKSFLGTADASPTKSLQKKTLSYMSLRSLAGDTDKASKTKEPKPHKPKKTKSITNLSGLLSRTQKNKENQSPVEPVLPAAEVRPPPIYAQFSSEYFAKQPLGGKFLEDEIDLYTPGGTCIRKQRDFFESYGQQPSLTKRDDGSSRPHSTYLPSTFSVQDIARRVSNGSRHSAEIIRRVSGAKRPTFQRASTDRSAATSESSHRSDKADRTGPSRGQRVLAAVAAFSSKDAKTTESESGSLLNDHNVDKEFEAMLDRRNIPEHQRGKMRNLALSMKKDFVRQDWAEIAAAKSGIPRNSESSAERAVEPEELPVVKSKRPRSRTFTISLSRASSKESLAPSKKKTESIIGKNSRPKSMEIVTGGTRSLTSASSVTQNLIAKAKGQTPDDFVSYLRKVTKPESVEVGRLHKLRLLLRNETVAWTDDFIRQGGMAEIVSLLHRTMEVEWREEHEDALLHEALLCLKALSTTALALKNLVDIQHTLFPALLHMIFDEEKKGPSEFTTRNIVTWLLFTYLKSAPISDRTHRAKILLSYLRNPEPTESQRPVEFVLEMRRERPYTTWAKEVSNVTKEVFWIFLHGLNVIALPGAGKGRLDIEDHEASSSPLSPTMTNSSFDISNPHHQYMAKHFPQERPPVPAAPYVGGVEWDATNYLASHLDIINGILSCLPTREERNELRGQMLVSGWEKCMGITLRTCKEKFYGGVHAGLRCWVAAAVDDGWDTKDVRNGPVVDKKSPVRRPVTRTSTDEAPPKIDLKIDFLGGGGGERKAVSDDVWL